MASLLQSHTTTEQLRPFACSVARCTIPIYWQKECIRCIVATVLPAAYSVWRLSVTILNGIICIKRFWPFGFYQPSVKKKKKISHRHWGPLRGSSSPFLALWTGEG